MRTLDELLSDPTLLARTDAFVRRPGATLRPPVQLAAELGGLGSDDALAGRLKIEGTLGEGGMGIVRLAQQTALGRRVAVKTLRDVHAHDRAAALKLLQEAWITGVLEHPNVVPVHDLYIDRDGRPQIVLKRVDGKRWADVMHDPQKLAATFGSADSLEHNLGVFVQVCHAVAFAHQRGIVHRDLKPENVMIGEFGEVVVLDWGIAVALRDDGSGRFPLARDATDAAGTPAYMAPEMLGGDTPRIGPTTDVYLLGALLYEITEGRAPHEGEGFSDLVATILASNPPLSSRTPDELARIIRRAMDPDPDARFEHVTQLRIAVQSFLRNEGSRKLLAEAERRRAALLAMIAQAEASPDAVAQERLHALFGECRFGYVEALRSWPDNREAARALREVTVAMVEHQLALGEPRVAAASLAGLSSPPPELRARVEQAVAAHDARRLALSELEREHDPRTGSRTRSAVALMCGLTWTLGPWLLSQLVETEHEVLILSPLLFLLAGAGMVGWGFDSLTKTAINRFLAAAVAWALGFQLLFAWGAAHLHVAAETSLSLTFLIWAFASAIIALYADRRLYSLSLIYVIGFALVLARPDLRWHVASAANIACVLIAFALWSPVRFGRPAPQPQPRGPALR